jgi:hypothetical protein
MEFNTELIRTNLPPKLICLWPYEFNFLQRLVTNGSQVVILLRFAPTSSPRYLKGTLPWILLVISMKLSHTFIPIRQLFEKFTLRPEAISKPLRIAFKVQRFSTEASPIQSVSSAYSFYLLKCVFYN